MLLLRVASYNKILVDINSFIQPACETRGLRALGLLLADGAPQWGGGRLFDGSTKFFYGNCCYSGTESRKINLKVGNEPSRQGLKMGH